MGALEKKISQLWLDLWCHDLDGRCKRGLYLYRCKYFYKFSILDKLLLAKEHPKLGILLPNYGGDNQSCHILKVIFNKIYWLKFP